MVDVAADEVDCNGVDKQWLCWLVGCSLISLFLMFISLKHLFIYLIVAAQKFLKHIFQVITLRLC